LINKRNSNIKEKL